MTREEQKVHRKTQILNVALDLFVMKGVYATKISDIASSAGMSVGLMFHYFPSKEALYIELVNHGLTSSKEQLTNTAKYIITENPIAFFEYITNTILKELKNNTYFAKLFVFMVQASSSDLLTEDIRYQLKWNNIKLTEDIIKIGQRSNCIRQGDSTSLAIAFWSAIQGICQLSLLDPNIPLPEAEWLIDIIRNK